MRLALSESIPQYLQDALPRVACAMYQILFFFFAQLLTTITAILPRLHTPYLTSNLPTCFPTRPHCIRPRVDECRDALSVMVKADPGYSVILGRPEIVGDGPRSYGVPRMWSSLPFNCIVKIDVTDPKAWDETILKTLTAPAEVVIRKCIMGGTGCGGSMLVGKEKVLRLTLAYYTSIEGKGAVLDVGRGNGIENSSREAWLDA
ncbi:MAG: hypothetical protein Q9169_004804 [Polycauliona sp. 2 TL-2023]